MNDETETTEIIVPAKKINLKAIAKKVLIYGGVILGTTAAVLLLTNRTHESDEPCGCDLPEGTTTPELDTV